MNMQHEAWQNDAPPNDGALGDILQRAHGLTAEQVAQVVQHQREHRLRFGEAAVALGLARPDDVIWALSQQYHYPYTPTTQQRLHDELVVANEPFNDEVEAFRDLRSQLMLGVMSPQGPRHALAITSSDTGDGKSFVAANLAIAFSQMPGRTLLIDANLRQPRLHKLFGVHTDTGLAGVLAGRIAPQVLKPVAFLSNLYLMPAGIVAPNPAELLQRPSFSLMLRDLFDQFDHILVDTPPHSAGSDARVTAVHCGAALVVGRKHASRTHGMQGLVKLLNKSQVKLAGVLLNTF